MIIKRICEDFFDDEQIDIEMNDSDVTKVDNVYTILTQYSSYEQMKSDYTFGMILFYNINENVSNDTEERPTYKTKPERQRRKQEEADVQRKGVLRTCRGQAEYRPALPGAGASQPGGCAGERLRGVRGRAAFGYHAAQKREEPGLQHSGDHGEKR